MVFKTSAQRVRDSRRNKFQVGVKVVRSIPTRRSRSGMVMVSSSAKDLPLVYPIKRR